ncbi:MAG: hypothetical protein KAI47_13625, partial [Deltaproteobacteria bacterium]|nr:hypothetical protein [Deltaproteobacteria bacterium]
AGCCAATGNCKNGSTNNACGLGGGQCAICDTTKNETCQTGVCKAINPTCNATTCPKGCCDDTGACVPGTASANCGKGGQACSQCGSNLACVLQKCSCTATSCSGCCEGDVCKAGSDVAACGTAGAVCVKCQVPKKCVSGQCLEDCSFLTCPGCCNGTTCMDPTNVSNCGAYGSQCTQCGGSDVCEKGTCNDATKCSKTNCPNGCCKDGVCQVGTLNGACGEGGDTCELCGEHLYCGVDPYWGTQECLANNASTWDVIVSKVVLDANPAKPWDSFLEKPGPDVFVEITVGGKTGRTSVKNNEFTPVFDEFVLTASAKDLGTKIRYEIRDDDTFGSDLIGDCTDVIYPSELKNGYIEISGCGGKPTNKDVISVSFKFVVKSK